MLRYFGSKASTAPEVADIALKGISAATACDAFGGLGNIAVELRRRGCEVTTCDLLPVPNAFQYCRVTRSSVPKFTEVRRALGVETHDDIGKFLGSRRDSRSWFVREYADTRQFFTAANASAIAGAWREIARWNRAGWLSGAERRYALVSLVNSVDAVANTAGTYYAFLKDWHRKALRPFRFEWLRPENIGPAGHVLCGDAREQLSGRSFDLLYLDPPYNNRDYSRYYHLPNTLYGLAPVEIDPQSTCGQPMVRSLKGRLIRQAAELSYLRDLCEQVGWQRLIVQYADGAHIPLDSLRAQLRTHGRLREQRVTALGYTTKTGSRTQSHHVFIVDK
jgi:adenine-specific DNA-methyltransferase